MRIARRSLVSTVLAVAMFVSLMPWAFAAESEEEAIAALEEAVA